MEGIKRLLREDFPQEDKALIDKLGGVLNPFLEQILDALNKNLDHDNLKREIKEVAVTVNASGIPTPAVSFRNTLNSKVKGINVVRAIHDTSTTTYPVSQPFISFTEENKLVKIDHISGLQASNKYNLTIETIG